MPFYQDQTGRNVELANPPGRIISLVPSQTELLHYLGKENEVVGITKFCVHPAHWFEHKTKVGGTKKIIMQVIHQLKPDLVIANKEENVKEQVESLSKLYPVWVSDVKNLNDATDMISKIDHMLGKIEIARELIRRIREGFASLKPQPRAPKTCYLIWREPYMTVGGDTFISDMLEKAGFNNLFRDELRYPETTIDQLRSLNPDVILLSSEPYPFMEKDKREMELLFPNTRIILVDGQMFSWYGSRLLKAPQYFRKLCEEL